MRDINKYSWPKHLYAIDVSRGIASLAVVLWHWQHFAYKSSSLSTDFVKDDQPFYGVLQIFYDAGIYGVDYFFLLSGFIFFWLYKDSIKSGYTRAWNFAVHRFSRLYPLHFVTLLIVAILQFFYFFRENVAFVYPSNDLFHFILNVFFASSWGFESGWSFNAPVWSVSIEILLYIIFFIVVFFGQGGVKFSLLVSIASIILFTLTQFMLFRGLGLFFLGGIVFHFAKWITTTPQLKPLIRATYIMTLAVWSSVIVNYYFFNLSKSVLSLGILGEVFLSCYPLFFVFPLTILSLVLLEIDYGAFLKSISWIGDITYSSYLLHFPLQLAFGLAVSYDFIGDTFYLNSFYFFLYFGLLISLSYFTFVAFEKPVQKYLRNILKRSHERF